MISEFKPNQPRFYYTDKNRAVEAMRTLGSTSCITPDTVALPFNRVSGDIREDTMTLTKPPLPFYTGNKKSYFTDPYRPWS